MRGTCVAVEPLEPVRVALGDGVAIRVDAPVAVGELVPVALLLIAEVLEPVHVALGDDVAV